MKHVCLQHVCEMMLMHRIMSLYHNLQYHIIFLHSSLNILPNISMKLLWVRPLRHIFNIISLFHFLDNISMIENPFTKPFYIWNWLRKMVHLCFIFCLDRRNWPIRNGFSGDLATPCGYYSYRYFYIKEPFFHPMNLIFVSEYICWFDCEWLSNTMYTIFGVYIFFLLIIV